MPAYSVVYCIQSQLITIILLKIIIYFIKKGSYTLKKRVGGTNSFNQRK